MVPKWHHIDSESRYSKLSFDTKNKAIVKIGFLKYLPNYFNTHSWLLSLTNSLSVSLSFTHSRFLLLTLSLIISLLLNHFLSLAHLLSPSFTHSISINHALSFYESPPLFLSLSVCLSLSLSLSLSLFVGLLIVALKWLFNSKLFYWSS
jgi:hypothetical protein